MQTTMPTITLKNVPEDLHRRLVARAARHRRSLNQEVIECLEKVTLADEPRVGVFDKDAFLAEVREARESLRKRGVWLTDESIRKAIDRDRDEMGDVA